METVDELLGPPTADELLGPEPGVRASPFLGDLLSNSAVGRVLKAFGDGVTERWGPDALGLSEDSANTLRRAGLFRSTEQSIFDGFKTFNEALIRPTAAGVEATVRGVNAAVGGVARAVGQVATELGDDEGRRLERDLVMLFDSAGVVAGTGPAHRLRAARRGREEPVSRPVAPEAPKPLLGEPGDFGIIPDQPTPLPARMAPEPILRGATDPFPRATDTIDKAGNINLDRIAAPEDVLRVIREAAETHDEFMPARRGAMTLQDTQDLAEALGMTPEKLAAREIGQAFNAEQAVAARNLLVQSADNVRDLARAAKGGSETDLLAFQQAVTRHAAIQEQVAGMTAEAGRALSSFRILAGANRAADDLAELIRQTGGRENIEAVATMVDKLDTPAKVSKYLMDTRQAGIGDMLIEYWINNLLTGPQTHITNVISNTLTSFLQVAETGVAGAIGAVRTARTGAADRVLPGEAAARLFGMIQGSREGLRAGVRAYLTETTTGGTKLETARPKAIPSATVTIAGRPFEIGGKQIRVPGRLLAGEDEFFKAIAYRQELNAQAYRMAVGEGLTGEALSARMADLVQNPSPEMMRAARDNATYQTFNRELGRMGGAVQQFANAHPSLRVIFPFIRTPINLVKYAGERTPLGLFSKKVRDNLSGVNGGVAQDTQMARLATGSALMVTVATLAAEGLVTGGGPKDPEQRAMLRLSGWQPYSFRIGDTWYSYQRLDPFATLFGIAADAVEVAQAVDGPDADKIGAMLLASVTRNLLDKTWTQGPADLLEAIQDPERYGGAYVRRLAGSLIPTGVAQAARVEDEYLRDARTLLDTLRSRLPGQSQSLPLRRDIWGEPIRREGSAGPDLFSPIYQSTFKNDPVTAELLKLRVFPAPVDRKLEGVELNAKQYDDYARVAGRLARMQLAPIIGQEGWSDLPETVRQEAIKGVISRSRQSARAWLLMEHPDLLQTFAAKRMGAP